MYHDERLGTLDPSVEGGAGEGDQRFEFLA